MFNFNHEGLQGVSFGIMDGIITVLGTLLGLSVINNKMILILGLLSVGIADSFANAAGIHVSQETEKHHPPKEVLRSTILCFFATLFTVLILVIPLIFLSLMSGIIVSLSIGIISLIALGVMVAHINPNFNAKKLALEYLIIGAMVAGLTFLLGRGFAQFL